MDLQSLERTIPQTDQSASGSSEDICPACRTGTLEDFLDLGQMPREIGTQWPSREAAIACQRGHIRLAFCSHCGFVRNRDFETAGVDYEHPYDNDLGFSAVYLEYERTLVERLIRDHDVRGKQVLEIGCGHGKFLKRLCAEGHNQGFGFDPSLTRACENGMTSESNGRVELIADYYPGRHGPRPADLIVCRQVFEHVRDPLQFLTELRATIADSDRPVLYFEVPNFEYVMSDLALWTIIYEHCSYFTRDSLRTVFENAGFEVLRVYDSFDGQFLGIEAMPAIAAAVSPRPVARNGEHAERIGEFAGRLKEKLAHWQEELAALAAEGKRVAVWGAGARAVCFLNLVKASSAVRCVVDINPNKVGKYMPGTGQPIIGPKSLVSYRPDVVIVMNDIYRDEIRGSVEKLGLSVRFLYA